MRRIITDESGATAIQYGLLASLVAVLLAATFVTLGDNLADTYEGVDEDYRDAAN